MTPLAPQIDPSLADLLPVLAARLLAAPPGPSGLVVAGICGAQGSGKTTLAHALEGEVARHGKRALTLSLDDFYLPRADRDVLARDVHPLCRTRGVPGTHDMTLYRRTVETLAAAGPKDETLLPVFSKLDDDRLPEDGWSRFVGRPDVVLFEGWCVGARPETGDGQRNPINDLEAREDVEGI